MKILESTDERLVIGQETHFIDQHKLMNLQLLVNVFLTVCFLPIWMNLERSTQRDLFIPSLAFYFIISSILVSVFYSGTKDGDYLFSLILYSIPIFGVGCLALTNYCMSQFRESKCLTFDRNLNYFKIEKFKFLFWNRSIQYPLNDLLAADLSTISVYAPSMHVVNMNAVRMARRRRRDGKVSVFFVASGHDANFLVNTINTFLHTQPIFLP